MMALPNTQSIVGPALLSEEGQDDLPWIGQEDSPTLAQLDHPNVRPQHFLSESLLLKLM